MAVEYTDNLGVKRRVKVEDISEQKGTKADEYEGEYWYCNCSGLSRKTMLKLDEKCPLCSRSAPTKEPFRSRWV